MTKYKTVIFVDSCFWHGCSEHYGAPATRKEFWGKKIAGNKERDQEVNQHYGAKGWNAIRVWEHELKRDRNKAIARVVANCIDLKK